MRGLAGRVKRFVERSRYAEKTTPPVAPATNFIKIATPRLVLNQQFDCIVIDVTIFTLTLQSGGYNEH